jgi:ABC-type transport system involved in multi-copper enzyme maturation permease subunit
MTALALRMTGADFLKLRKKRGTLIWALVLALGPLLAFFVVRAIQHSSDPSKYAPAGGIGCYPDALRLLAVFFGPLAAILIGAVAGAGDVASGVFRDLVATGRSRLALFASRLPAALGLCWLVSATGYVLLIAGTFVFASGSPTPSAHLLLEGLGFTLLYTGAICLVAVGFASLTALRTVALTVLIGWQLVASPILANIGSLGNSREAILSQALVHFSPVDLGGGMHGTTVSMSALTALIVLVVWIGALTSLGAWRTVTIDA